MRIDQRVDEKVEEAAKVKEPSENGYLLYSLRIKRFCDNSCIL